MFTRDFDQPDVDPYFRALYLLQFVAALAITAGMALTWWSGMRDYSAFDLLGRSINRFKEDRLFAVFQPLLLLWLLWPLVLISLLRGITGILVTPVSYRVLALVLWVVALLVLAHFYINFGDEDLSDQAPLKNGVLAVGFWLTSTSTTLLGLLILAEMVIKPQDVDRFAPHGPATMVDDAERIWRGDYQSCPYCGTLNEPGAKTCYSCHNLLFSITDDSK